MVIVLLALLLVKVNSPHNSPSLFQRTIDQRMASLVAYINPAWNSLFYLSLSSEERVAKAFSKPFVSTIKIIFWIKSKFQFKIIFLHFYGFFKEQFLYQCLLLRWNPIFLQFCTFSPFSKIDFWILLAKISNSFLPFCPLLLSPETNRNFLIGVPKLKKASTQLENCILLNAKIEIQKNFFRAETERVLKKWRFSSNCCPVMS